MTKSARLRLLVAPHIHRQHRNGKTLPLDSREQNPGVPFAQLEIDEAGVRHRPLASQEQERRRHRPNRSDRNA